MRCFVHFDWQMCFSPQRRVFFRHRSVKKWSRIVSFWTFSLPNVLFATAAYNFATSELPKVVPDPQFFDIFTSECAFRHSGVQFCDIRTQNFQKWSRTLSFLTFLLPNVLFATAACNFWCHLSAPTSAPAALTDLLLDWPDTRIYEKTQHFVTSLTFGADVSSFLLTFWLLHLLSTDSTTPLLLFNSPYCRKFLFKLPSITGSLINPKPPAAQPSIFRPIRRARHHLMVFRRWPPTEGEVKKYKEKGDRIPTVDERNPANLLRLVVYSSTYRDSYIPGSLFHPMFPKIGVYP